MPDTTQISMNRSYMIGSAVKCHLPQISTVACAARSQAMSVFGRK